MDNQSVIYVHPNGVAMDGSVYERMYQAIDTIVQAISNIWKNVKQLLEDLILDGLPVIKEQIKEQRNTAYKTWDSTLIDRTRKFKSQVTMNKPLTVRIRNNC